MDVDASVWEDADITPTTTQEEEEEEFKDETEVELTQTLEEVSLYTLPDVQMIAELGILLEN